MYLCIVEVQIMAIGNITPDSFYSASRLMKHGEDGNYILQGDMITAWGHAAIAAGASILDIGGCSTRPGSEPVEEAEEWRRVAFALASLRSAIPDATISLDTFRSEIARRALEEFGPLIINDISGGNRDMYEVVRRHGAKYVWTLRGDYSLPATHPEMGDIDLILDPGIGFTSSIAHDRECLERLGELRAYGYPILVGVSRKRVVYQPLGLNPENCGEATQAMQLYAVEQGASIIRTHDVRATARTLLRNQ